uniref:ATP-dependent DNA helicase n=1 Tax=Quercus lobata TaxID=97700 RepID=A0A7N2MWF6_QUELO
MPRIIQDELTIPMDDEELTLVDKLNNDQKFAYNTIMEVIQRKQTMAFFVDGPGGTGKMFLYRALLASLRSDGHIAIATATSGIAATLLPGGRTAHSRFKIPLIPEASSTCSISKQSDLAELIRRAVVLIWDEAPMVNRRALEALDRTLQDLMEINSPFGGKVLILGGDFRQVLPVIPKGTKAELLDACIVNSPLWRYIKILHLTQNMRSINDQQFSEYIRRIGDGIEPFATDDLIKVPSSMAIPWEGDHSIAQLIEQVFPDLQNHAYNARYMVDRALLTPINEDVDKLNEKIITQFPGEEQKLYSFDEVEDDTQHLYQQDFLNSISPGGLPPHILRLKKGAPIMLLRNIDPKVGLCNGTRLLCRGCFNNVIDAEILTGQYAGTRVFLPRIPLKTTENVHLPFVMIRRQFPIRLSFALTINKAQGQTIPNVGIYLPDHVFSHGQLYVALSRGVSQSTTKLLVQKGTIPGEEGVHTKNIVYKEILLHSS